MCDCVHLCLSAIFDLIYSSCSFISPLLTQKESSQTGRQWPTKSAHCLTPASPPVHLSLPSLAFMVLHLSLRHPSISMASDESEKVDMNRLNVGVLRVLRGIWGIEGLLLLRCIRHGRR